MPKGDFPVTITLKASDLASPELEKLAANAVKLGAKIAPVGKKVGDAFKPPDALSGWANVTTGFHSLLDIAEMAADKLLEVGRTLFELGKKSFESGTEIARMAERTGLGADAFASLSYAARQADVDQESFNGAISKFAKNLGDAKAGGGSLLTFLEKVGPKFAGQVKHAKSTEEALSLMTDAFARIEDPTKRAALASAAFGKSGLQMATFLHQGSAAIQEWQDQFIQVHGSVDKLAARSPAVEASFKKLDTAFSGLRDTAAAGLFPALTKAADALTGLLADPERREKLADWADKTGKAFSAWGDSDGLKRVTEDLGKLADIAEKVENIFGDLSKTGVFKLIEASVESQLDFAGTVLDPDALSKLMGVGPRAPLQHAQLPARSTLDLSKAAPAVQSQPADARISVDFTNMPRGARASQSSSGPTPVDMSVGYSLVAP